MKPARVIQLPNRQAPCGAGPDTLDREPRGEAYWERADISGAIECWTDLLRRDPARVDLRVRIGEAAIAECDWQHAASELSQCTAALPADADLASTLAACYLHLDQQDAAWSAVEQALRAEPGHRLANAVAALLPQPAETARPALIHWDDAPADRGGTIEQSLFAEAVRALEMGYLEEAHRRLEEVLLIRPSHWETLFEIGHLSERKGRTAWAGFYYGRAITACRQAWEPHYNLARLYFEQKDWEAARPLLERSLLLEPRAAGAAWLLANVCHEQGDAEEAGHWLAKAHELDPANAEVAAQLALWALERGQLVAAAGWFERASALAPARPELAYNLGLCRWKLGQTAEAQQAWLAHRGEPAVAQLLGASYCEQQQWQALDELLAKNENPLLRLAAALRLEDSGAAREAIRHYQACIALDPASTAAWINLGRLLRQAGDESGATRAWQRALELEPAIAAEYFA